MGLREALEYYGNMLDVSFSITDGSSTTNFTSEQIVSFTPHYEGGICQSVMRCLDIELDGVSDVVGDTVLNAKWGCKTPDDANYFYKQYGTYIIKDKLRNESSNALNLTCYDKMLESMIPYDLALDYSTSITVKDLLDAVCDRLGWTGNYSAFVNSDVVIDEEKFSAQDTFRTVIDEIAQVSASTIAFDASDRLCVMYPHGGGTTWGDLSGKTWATQNNVGWRDGLPVLSCENLSELEIGEEWGEVNAVVLARTPQEDNIYRRDETSIEANGLCEIKIENNQIMDSHRDDFIDEIFDQLKGMKFRLFSLGSFGIGIFDLLDAFMLSDLDGNLYETIMLSDEIVVAQGITETASAREPSVSVTNYAAADTTDRHINRAEMLVDKQNQTITALTQRVADGEAKATKFTQDVEGFNFQFTTVNEKIDNNQKETEKYIRFKDGAIELGEEGDSAKFSARLSQEEMQFLDNGSATAWLSNSVMHVTRGEFLVSCQIGNFAFVPRENGSLDFKKVV